MKALLAAGANSDLQDVRGRTPLHWAVLPGHGETAKELLDAGANPDLQDEDGMAPLHLAVSAGLGTASECHEETVKALLAANANPNLQSQGGSTPLQWAELLGRKEIVRILLAAGANACLLPPEK